MDVTLSIDDQEIWEQRRQRLEALIGANPSQQQHDPAQPAQIMDPLLYTAVKEGDVDKFIKALEDHCARAGVSLPVVLRQLSPSWNTFLHAAAESDDILRVVIDFVPDHLISWANSSGETPLHIAARAGKTGVVELLLTRANPRVLSSSGNSPLHEAVRNRHYEVIHRLVSQDPNPLFHQNKESKSPWCVAVETGDLEVLKLLLEVFLEILPDPPVPFETVTLSAFGMSPAHVAVMYRKMDMLTEMWNKMPVLLIWKDEGHGTPLHFAVYTNYLDGVKFLIEKFPLSALEQDKEGYLPIHVACMMDHVRIVEELLQQWPDPAEFRAKRGENILHVSARYGCISTVKYIMKSPEFGHLLNVRDFDLNTPLHLAALHCQPLVLLLLARDGRVDLKLVNERNMTALDVVEENMKEKDAPLRKRLMRIILASAGTPRSGELAICKGTDWSLGKEMKPPELDRLKEEANTRMVVAALMAAMTFASGFSVPGGYNGSNPNAGIAVLLHKAMYNVFVISNSITMYSSIIALVILLWTQINDPHAVRNALSKSRLPLLVALAAMPLAFMAGVYVSITKLSWLAIVVLVLGSVALFIILSFYLLLYIPLGCNHPLVRRFTDLIIVVGISMSGRVTAGSGTAGRATTSTGANRDAGDYRMYEYMNITTNIIRDIPVSH
ncbi:protein ACCELERATED CELL DEATH 6-like [Syzygium oleosum]|uniref:protein ACCELERATED CELL DEATH 6-like n=1 Tax=Syzygium oleosum TaxID=219896 RepID=UPI0024B9391B|nr:protein ACCELERATED CELL DEATH 6-like [Syzygium oleosum]